MEFAMRGRNSIILRILACVTMSAVVAGTVLAQHLPAVSPPQAPLLYLRLAGPKGMKVTVYRGQPAGVTLEAPCVIGVRPGYAYRVSLSNIAGFPAATFSPTIEVRGSLWLTSQLRNSEFPATVLFRADDFAKVEQGTLIKKIIVLEHPDMAEPIPARPEEPLEISVPAGRELQHEVQGRGAPLAVVFLGQRSLSEDEFAAGAISGTVLLPGEKTLPPPSRAPWVPWGCYALQDPLHGRQSPADYLSVYDGGDNKLPAGYDSMGKLRGLDPSDTLAEYIDAKGRPRIVASNCVALCVPRFLILKTETGLVTQTVAFGPGSAHVSQERGVFTSRLPFIEHSQPLHLESAANRMKPSGTQFTVGTAITGDVNGLQVSSVLLATNTLDGSCPPPTSPAPERPLRIIKWPDKKGCNVGELVMFSLRYTNHGSQPITNLVVSDSLTTRFEYVPGSQKSDREVRFTTQPNEASSRVLRWEFPGALQPGESGLITFQVRVR
jgi:uncharacterized repeat protein (TIGR01451 family)